MEQDPQEWVLKLVAALDLALATQTSGNLGDLFADFARRGPTFVAGVLDRD
jgi:hypothetical protein